MPIRTMEPTNVRTVVSKSAVTAVKVSLISARAGLHFFSASMVAWLVMASTTMPTMMTATVMKARLFFMNTAPSDRHASTCSKLIVVVPVTFTMSVTRPPPVTAVRSTPVSLGTFAPFYAFSVIKFTLVSRWVPCSVPMLSGASMAF